MSAPSAESADLNYYYGIAAAQLGQWQRAREALLAGMRLAPSDPRFPTELAGVAFREKRNAEAASWLRKSLRLDNDDEYASNFLATVYFLNGNLEAALKYWNHTGRPQINAVRTGTVRVKPELLDRAFVFAPASAMRLPDFLTTEKRVEGLGIFPRHNVALSMRDDGTFDVDFRARERNGMGSGPLQAAASTLRGVLWSTVYPEYYNIGQSAINFTSLVRWDAQKRRLFASLSAPVRGNPKYRLQFGGDLRNENWDVRQGRAADVSVAGLNVRREATQFSFTAFSNGQWTWTTGAEFSHRDYRNVLAGPSLRPVLLSGYQLKHQAKVEYTLLRLPERRITTTLFASAETGKIWSTTERAFEKLQTGLRARWMPGVSRDDYTTELHVRYGRTLGEVPFDELHMLGLERDTDLPMRAHRGASDGRKGNSPLGRNYFLTNLESDKIVFECGLLLVSLSPFLDVGKATDPVADLGSQRWLFDTGVQLKFRVWGLGFVVTYGKDLRSGKNAFYVATGR